MRSNSIGSDTGVIKSSLTTIPLAWLYIHPSSCCKVIKGYIYIQYIIDTWTAQSLLSTFFDISGNSFSCWVGLKGEPLYFLRGRYLVFLKKKNDTTWYDAMSDPPLIGEGGFGTESVTLSLVSLSWLYLSGKNIFGASITYRPERP